MNFADLEYLLRRFVSQLIQSKDFKISLLILDSDKFRELTEKFEILLIYNLTQKKLLTNELKDEIKKWKRKLDKKASQRNEYIHKVIMLPEKGEVLSIVKLDKVFETQETHDFAPRYVKDIKEFAKQIGDTILEFHKFEIKILRMLFPESFVK